MKYEPMRSVANNRSGFERNFFILAELMRNGKMHFSSHTQVEGISKVKYLPNGRINFLTVNESARLMANSSANWSDKGFYDGKFDENEE